MYELKFTTNVLKFITSNKNKHIIPRLLNKIAELKNEPRITGCKKLVDNTAYRIKVGDYRVIYEIDDENGLLTIIHISHRKDAY